MRDEIIQLNIGRPLEKLEKLETLGLTAEQRAVLGPKLERESLADFNIQSLPNSDLKGVNFVLRDQNNEIANTYVDKRVLTEFPFVTVENIQVMSYELSSDMYNLRTFDFPQGPHHDSEKLADADLTVGLYHPPLEGGQTIRRAPTMLGDGQVTWAKALKWIRENYNNDRDANMDEELEIYWDYVKMIIEDPGNFVPEFYKGHETHFSLDLQMTKWGIDPDSEDGMLISATNSRAAVKSKLLGWDLYNASKDDLLPVKWKPKKLLMFDNVRLVHGRGPAPENWRFAGNQGEASLLSTTLSNLVKK